ncbi:MAG: DUF1329 domain-containing protein, partial [Candidatus Binataceae bacterium]
MKPFSATILVVLGLGYAIIAVLANRAFAGAPAGFSAVRVAQAEPTQTPSARNAALSPGTSITMQNWRQYRDFMPDGMALLFEGSFWWKMPVDVEMNVGPTVIHPLPAGYLAATEKYRSSAKLVELADGGLNLTGYQGGIPFPQPDEPHKGWKILANFWLRYMPHIVVNAPDNLGFHCTLDAFANVNCVKGLWVARQLSYNTDPGVPATIDGAGGKYYSTWFMVQEPEQQRYTTTLTIEYTDLTRPEDVYTFSPATRRTQRLSAAARCASSGSDTTPDDARFGFDSSIPEFDASLLGEKRILAMMDIGSAGSSFPASYDMPLGWPKPAWGKWEVRDVDVLDLRKLPDKAAGYCYGKRIMYVD